MKIAILGASTIQTVKSAAYFFHRWIILPHSGMEALHSSLEKGKSCQLHHHSPGYQELT